MTIGEITVAKKLIQLFKHLRGIFLAWMRKRAKKVKKYVTI